MNKTTFFAMLIASGTLLAQEKKSVEKSIFNVQAGFVGLYANNELKLYKDLVLRTEVGLEPSWFVGNGTIWHPNLRLEPRYYYNMGKRSEDGKNIQNNSGNFFGVAFNYRPAANLFKSSDNIRGIESYSVVPKWGIRRSFAKNFNYEAGVGFGYRHEVDYGNFAEIDLHLRIGYSF